MCMVKNKIFLFIITLFLFPAVVQANTREIRVQWQHENTTNIAGYRLYHENVFICEINNPAATSINCNVDVPDGETWFTMTSFWSDGTESAHSSPYIYTFSSDLEANITTDIQAGNSPLFVIFNGVTSTGDIDSYEWFFGDGHSSSGSVANHTYNSVGTYIATLTVTDTSGSTDQDTVTINVTDSPENINPPTARFTTFDNAGVAPFLVELDASTSSDSDGTIISYTWDLGDGSTATGPNITHKYTSTGTFTPTLTVTDNDGLTDTASVSIEVESQISQNIPPTAIISLDTAKGKAPLAVAFNASNSVDPDGNVSFCSWHFGDGTISSNISTKHTFTQPGKYTVTLCVTDDLGANSELAKVVIEVKKSGDEHHNSINLQPILNYLLLHEKE